MREIRSLSAIAPLALSGVTLFLPPSWASLQLQRFDCLSLAVGSSCLSLQDGDGDGEELGEADEAVVAMAKGQGDREKDRVR